MVQEPFDPWDDYFDKPMLEPDKSARDESSVDAREPVFGTVKVVFDDGTCLITARDGKELLCINDVFPVLQPGHPVVAFPVDEGGWSFCDPQWYVFPSLESIAAFLNVTKARMFELVRKFIPNHDIAWGMGLNRNQVDHLLKGIFKDPEWYVYKELSISSISVYLRIELSHLLEYARKLLSDEIINGKTTLSWNQFKRVIDELLQNPEWGVYKEWSLGHISSILGIKQSQFMENIEDILQHEAVDCNSTINPHQLQLSFEKIMHEPTHTVFQSLFIQALNTLISDPEWYKSHFKKLSLVNISSSLGLEKSRLIHISEELFTGTHIEWETPLSSHHFQTILNRSIQECSLKVYEKLSLGSFSNYFCINKSRLLKLVDKLSLLKSKTFEQIMPLNEDLFRYFVGALLLNPEIWWEKISVGKVGSYFEINTTKLLDLAQIRFPDEVIELDTLLHQDHCHRLLNEVLQDSEIEEREIRKPVEYTYGDRVLFSVVKQDEGDPNLLYGVVSGMDAIVPRSVLYQPQCLPMFPLECFAKAGKLPLNVVDPSSRPIRLGNAFTALDLKWLDPISGEVQSLERVGPFFLALHAITQYTATIPADIFAVDDDNMTIAVYGVLLDIFSEQASWDRNAVLSDLYQCRKTIDVHVSVDLDHFLIHTSLKQTDGLEWNQMLTIFPEGSVVRDAYFIAQTREGLLFDLPSTGLRLQGIVPYGELTDGNDPYSYYDELDKPLDLLVIGHDEARHRLRLSWRHIQHSVWDALPFQEGELIPVEVAFVLPQSMWVRWAPGHLTEIKDAWGRKKSVFWARVKHIDVSESAVELSICEVPSEWEVIEVEDGTIRLRSEDGDKVRILQTPSLANAEIGRWLLLHLESVSFKLQGPEVRCKPLSNSEKEDIERAGKIWDEVKWAYENNELIEGTVVARIRGGFSVDIGSKAFLPGSQVDIWPVKNLDKFIGQKLKMKVIKFNRKRGNIVLSRRAILEEERQGNKREILASLEEGQILEGVVKNITDYGAFIDLGGIDGLLHITEMSWGRVNHPSKLYSVGDRVKVKVIKYDRESERVFLGVKQITPDPWDEVETRHPVGSRVQGKVVRIVDYSTFVELEEGVEGLVHVSELTWNKQIKHPSKVVSLGDGVEAVVLNVDQANKRISLGMKQLKPNPWSTIKEKYPIGSIVEGEVHNIIASAAFLALEDGIDGMIHISDISWTKRIKHPSEVLKKKQRISAMVLNVDQENERLSLGLKQLTPDPWEKVGKKYKVGDIVTAKIVKLANFGAFAEIEEGIEGLIHNSELAQDQPEKPHDVVSVGDHVRVKLIRVDITEKKIGLSIKACQEEMEIGDTDITKEGVITDTNTDPSTHMEIESNAELSQEEMETYEDIDISIIANNPPKGSLQSFPSENLPALNLQEETQTGGFDPRHLLARMIESPEDQDDGHNNTDPKGPPPSALEDLDSDLETWLQGFGSGYELICSLEQKEFFTLASFHRVVERMEKPADLLEPIPAWATLGVLLHLQGERQSQGRVGLTVPSLDLLLRAILGNPVEILLYEMLSSFLPPPFVVRHADAIGQWLREQSISPSEYRIGLTILKTRALDRLGKIEKAFSILNPLVAEEHDNGLIEERDRLVKLFREELESRPLFFERFERLWTETIRRGGFAYIIPVRKRDTGEIFALKHYLLRSLNPEEMRLILELFEHEAAFLSRIHHQNVVTLHEILDDGCILLEWLAGRPLEPESDGLGDSLGWWDIRCILDLGYCIASALEAVDQTLGGDFVHNDLAPRNVVIDPKAYDERKPWVKIIDFGLSVSPHFYSLSTVIDEIGVRLREPYRAPEVVAGNFNSPRSDMYSLGVILFQLITRCLPASSVVPQLDPVLKLEKEKIYNFAEPGVASLICRLLASKPAQRPAHWGEVAAELKRFIA